MPARAESDFGTLLRHWRHARRFSQLDLALQADISTKHVSFLETGRNRPSREMIMRLATAMDLPLRDRNLMLAAAGFAGAYPESALDSPLMSQAQEALRRILDKHEPYPAIVMDSDWNIVRLNAGARALGSWLRPGAPPVAGNALEILFSDDGLAPFVGNWDRVASILLSRLFRDSVGPGASEMNRSLFDRLRKLPSTPPNWREIASGQAAGPTIDMVFEKDGTTIRFFTTITTFGTPQDVTLQELRIESYFPGDAATRRLCERWT